MRTLLICFWLASGALHAVAQGLTLSQGQSVRFSFDHLDFLQANTNTFSTLRAGLGFIPPGMSTGESLQLSFYPDSDFLGTSFFTQSITVPPGGIFYGAVGFDTPSTAWDDLDGGIQVTMLNGSVDVSDVFFDVNRPGERFFAVQTVPELNSFGLVFIGLTSLLCARRTRTTFSKQA